MLTLFTLTADIQTSVQLNLWNSILSNPESGDNSEQGDSSTDYPNPIYGVGGHGKISFNSVSNRDVKAHLSLLVNINTMSQSSIILDRGYIITRFGDLRLRLGKTRLVWGEGSIFNVADLVMGASDLEFDLTTDEFRNQSVWMGSLYLSLNPFAFFEVVVLPPMPDTEKGKIAVGGRFLAQAANTPLKIEGGYFYKNNDESHQAYFSLHGGRGLNWYLNSALNMNSETISDVKSFFTGLKISGGLHYLKSFFLEKTGTDLSLGMRAEVLFDNGNSFSEETPSSLYGLYTFLEIYLSIENNINTYLRSIISPIDGSVIFILGGSFALYQGLSLYSNIGVQFGDADDTFTNKRPGGYVFLLGFQFIF